VEEEGGGEDGDECVHQLSDGKGDLCLQRFRIQILSRIGESKPAQEGQAEIPESILLVPSQVPQ